MSISLLLPRWQWFDRRHPPRRHHQAQAEGRALRRCQTQNADCSFHQSAAHLPIG